MQPKQGNNTVLWTGGFVKYTQIDFWTLKILYNDYLVLMREKELNQKILTFFWNFYLRLSNSALIYISTWKLVWQYW